MPDCVTARSGPGSAVGAVCSRGAEQHTTAAAGTTTSDGYAEAAGPAVAAVADHHGVAAVAPVTTVAFNAWGAVAAFPAVAAAPAVTDQPGVAAGAAVTGITRRGSLSAVAAVPAAAAAADQPADPAGTADAAVPRRWCRPTRSRRCRRSRSSGGYLLDEPPDMTPSFPRTGVSGHAGAVHTIYGDFTTGYIVTPSLPTDFRTAPDAGRRARARR